MRRGEADHIVSIPFKRESVFKAGQEDQKFQFPSNGKVYSKKNVVEDKPPNAVESFNSLQTGKCIQRMKSGCVVRTAFQFPSNGKVDSAEVTTEIRAAFQFPSNGKVDSKWGGLAGLNAIWFQFPSNGKVDSKVSADQWFGDVSIPFKRESDSKKNGGK